MASLAIAFGAQGLVSDVVTGFFILLERQLDVGDTITIGLVNGTVEALDFEQHWYVILMARFISFLTDKLWSLVIIRAVICV